MKNLTRVLGGALLLILLAPAAALAQGTGCDLGFLPLSGAAPTINGTIGAGEWDNTYSIQSGNCVTPLPDVPSGSTSTTDLAADLPAHAVVIRTARNNTHLFILIDVNDQTSPLPPGSGGIGDQVVIVFNPNNSLNDTLPQLNDFLLKLLTFRGPNVDTKTWAHGSASAMGNAWIADPMPAGVLIERADRALGYVVEAQIPLTVLGYPVDLTTNPPAENIIDIGIAVAVMNDLGFQEMGTTMMTGANFPDTPQLELTDNGNLVEFGNPEAGNWKEPRYWATGFLTGAGQSVFFSHVPYNWKSEDIKVGLTSASVLQTDASFNAFTADVHPSWYKYKTSGTPCVMRVWARFRRNVGVGDIRRRVLFLWGQHGVGQPRWRFVHLTGPVTLSPGATVAFTIGKEWTGVPANNPNHPCLRAFILPETDRPGFEASVLQNIGNAPGENDTFLNNMMAAYGLANNDWAQMNIGNVDNTFNCSAQPTVPCNPACVSQNGDGLGDESPLRFVNARLGVPTLDALRDAAAAEAADASAQTATAPRRGKFFLDLEVYGRPAGAPRRYSFVQHIGGVAEVVDLARLQEQGRLTFPFMVGNRAKVPRRIFVVPHLRLPPGVTGIRVSVAQPQGVFQPGETRDLIAVVTRDGTGGDPTDPPRDPGDVPAPAREKRWGLSLHAGGSFPHGSFSNIFNPGFNAGLDLEYRLNDYVSLEGIYTFHRFRAEDFGFFRPDDLNVHQFSINGKLYGGTTPVRPFFNFGGGAYTLTFDPSDTRGGVNVGGGLQFNLTPTFAVEGSYNFHNVFTPLNDTRFSTVQGGVRFRF